MDDQKRRDGIARCRKVLGHAGAALTAGGFTPDDIEEILRQAIYCSVPAANPTVKGVSRYG